MYPKLVIKTAEFMENYRDKETGLPKASFDMWEEKAGVFTSTASCVCSALSSAAKFAKVFYDSKHQESLNKVATEMKTAIRTHLFDEKLGRFAKAIYANGHRDLTIDSSLAFTFLSETFDAEDPEVKQTMETVFKRLWVDPGIGGLARYENDDYHRVSKDAQGNPWFICTLWLARWYIKTAQKVDELKKGLDILAWVTKYSLPSGILAEQLNPYDASPISVSPLVWSHAEFVIAVCEYLEKYQQLTSQ
jgi:GH15 family glucan-1,4-alpha-glucosidase